MDDAIEAFESILTSLHDNMTTNPPEAEACEPACFVHQTFGVSVIEQTQCSKCHASSEPLFSQAWIYYGYVNQLSDFRTLYPRLGFDSLINLVDNGQALRSCSNEQCNKKNQVFKYLALPSPNVFTIGLVWDSPQSSADQISNLFDLLDEQINLRHIFPNIDQDCPYVLRGIICFYTNHYMAFFQDTDKGMWATFDDEQVKEVGPFLQQHVREKCRLGRLQPLIFFYEKKTEPPDINNEWTEFEEKPQRYADDQISFTGDEPQKRDDTENRTLFPSDEPKQDTKNRAFLKNDGPGKNEGLWSNVNSMKRKSSREDDCNLKNDGPRENEGLWSNMKRESSREDDYNLKSAKFCKNQDARGKSGAMAPKHRHLSAAQQPTSLSSAQPVQQAHCFGVREDKRLDDGEDEDPHTHYSSALSSPLGGNDKNANLLAKRRRRRQSHFS